MKRLISTYDPKKRKDVKVGVYDWNTRSFYKKVNSRHFMIKEGGYGIQEEVINQLKHLGCENIKINTKNNLYEFDFETILNKPIKNYGHGNQRFLKI